MHTYFISYIYKTIMLNKQLRSFKRPYPSNDLLETESRTSCVINERVKRRNYAILMMYRGWGYYGMHRCPGFATIEGDLSKALVACGQMEELTTNEFQKIHFQRASKTDKSVSAIGQVCSLMLKQDEDIIQNLNNHLPDCIRVLDVIRSTAKFNAKYNCSCRVYDYLLPSFTFGPKILSVNDTDCWKYRITADRFTYINTIFQRYKGTHNFYNFTSRRGADDKSCQRYIISIECLPAFLIDDREYINVRICGQSFMLHQIRKMIGLILGISKGYTTESVFDLVFGKERIDIPKAPGLGLMLNEVLYNQYNERYKNDGIHNPIGFEEYEEQRDAFKQNYIYNHIDQIEMEEKSMYEWLQTLGRHSYSCEHFSELNSSAQAKEMDNSTINIIS